MREPSRLSRGDKKELEVQNTKAVDITLNLIDALFAGQRFGEFDSAKQMFLMSCQEKIDKMQRGYYTESNITFLNDTIEKLLVILHQAKDDVYKGITLEYFNEEEKNDG